MNQKQIDVFWLRVCPEESSCITGVLATHHIPNFYVSSLNGTCRTCHCGWTFAAHAGLLYHQYFRCIICYTVSCFPCIRWLKPLSHYPHSGDALMPGESCHNYVGKAKCKCLWCLVQHTHTVVTDE